MTFLISITFEICGSLLGLFCILTGTLLGFSLAKEVPSYLQSSKKANFQKLLFQTYPKIRQLYTVEMVFLNYWVFANKDLFMILIKIRLVGCSFPEALFSEYIIIYEWTISS